MADIAGILSSSATPVGTDVAITEANASCCIKLTGRAWCTAAKDQWGPLATTYNRYNRSRVIDCGTVTSGIISFEAICLPGTPGGASAGSADPYVCVVVDGQLFKTVTLPCSFIPIRYNIGLPAGARKVQLWDGWQSRQENYNASTDGILSGCYVTTVRVPGGQPSPALIKADRGVVIWGDSTLDGIANTPYSWNGWGGQVRRALHAVGGLCTELGWGGGTMRGDGLTHAQFAQCISDAWATMGTLPPRKQFFLATRPNDGAYSALAANHPTPAEWATFVGQVLDDLTGTDPGYKAIIAAPGFAQGSGQQSYGGGTRTQYYDNVNGLQTVASGRLQVTIRDYSNVVDPNVDLSEGAVNGVHLAQTGHDKMAKQVKMDLGGLS